MTTDMKLIATALAKRDTTEIKVFDDRGRAYIVRRHIKSGKVSEWRSPDRTAKEWVSINDTIKWSFAEK